MADQNKYTLPIGINPQDFFEGINAINKGIDSLETNVADANKGMQSAFKQSSAESEKLEKTISGNSDAITVFAKQTEAATKQTSTLLDTLNLKLRRLKADLANPGSFGSGASIRREIEVTTRAIERETEALKKNTVVQKSLAQQLLVTKNQMAQLTIAGKGQSVEYTTLQARALELAKVQKQVGDETKIAGEKSANVLSKSFGILRQLAFLIPGIGIAGLFNLAFEAVAKLVVQMDLFKKKNEEVNNALKQGEKDATAQVVSLDTLYRATQNTTLSLEQRTAAVIKLKEQYPNYFENIKTETFLNGGAEKSYNSLKDAILATARAKAIEGAITKIITDGLDEETRLRQNVVEAQKKQTEELNQQLTVTRKDQEGALIRQDLSIKESNRFRQSQVELAQKVLQNFKDSQNKQTKALEESLDKQEEIVLSHPPITGSPEKIKTDGEKAFNEQQAQLKRIADLNKQLAFLTAKEADGELQRQLEKLDAQKKVTEDLLDIEESKIKHKQETGKKLTELDKQELTAIQKVRDQLEKNLASDKSKVTEDFVLKQAALVTKANIEIAESLGNLQEMEITKLQEGYNLKLLEYQKQYKELPDKLKELQEAAEKKRSQDAQEIRLKYALIEQDQIEKLQLASVNLAFGFQELSTRAERERQEAILQIQLQASKNRLQKLIDSGKAESDLLVVQAREVVARLEGELGNLAKSPRKFKNLFDLLGFEGDGGLSPEQVDAIQAGVNEIILAYKSVTDAILEENRRQQDSSKERIDAIDKEIDTLQGQFDKEEELRKRGLANNAQYYADQIALQKKAKDDEVKNREELFEKQKAIQRQQLVLDSISQGSSLVTASANVMEGFSTIPIIGVGLGLAAVGAMIAGFILSKVAAFNAINNQKQSFGEGGTIDGKSHSEGGKKYIAADGSGMVTELESGEEVIRKKQASKFRSLLKAINNDSISGLSDAAMAELFRGTGIHLQTDIPEEGTKINQEFEAAHSAVFVATSGRVENTADLKAIREDVGYLADRKRNEVETWEDAFFFYERKGNVTTKIAK